MAWSLASASRVRAWKCSLDGRNLSDLGKRTVNFAALSLELALIRPGGIGQRLQPQGCGAGDAERHALSGRGMEAMHRRLADDLRTEGIGDNQPGVLREDLAGHLNRGGKKQPVAMQ